MEFHTFTPPVFVAIQGPTCSGKSTLARRLCERHENSKVICLDRFYHPFDRGQSSDPLVHNYDCPDALDWASLLDFVKSLERTGRGTVPIFDYVTGLRRGAEEIWSPKLVVLEGLWPFVNADLLTSLAFKVYVDAAPDIRLLRRIRRDVLGVSRGFDLEASLLYYEFCTRPMEREFVVPGKSVADLLIEGDASLSENVKTINEAIRIGM